MHQLKKDFRTPVFALAACTLAVSAAHAAEPTFEEQLAKFSNVRIVHAPAAASSTPTAGQGGLKAYKDSETGELRGPTQEELDAESSAAAPAKAAATGRRSVRAATATMQTSPYGGNTAKLDDSMMQFTVVTRLPDGTFAEYCATGKEEADAVTKAGVPVASKGDLQ